MKWSKKTLRETGFVLGISGARSVHWSTNPVILGGWKSGPTPAKILEKNCRLQQDSNSDRWSRKWKYWVTPKGHWRFRFCRQSRWRLQIKNLIEVARYTERERDIVKIIQTKREREAKVTFPTFILSRLDPLWPPFVCPLLLHPAHAHGHPGPRPRYKYFS